MSASAASKGGAEDVKQHYYFSEVDWSVAAAGGLKPTWLPDPPGEDDPWGMGWFRQDEERDSFAAFSPQDGPEVLATQQHLFANW